MIKNSARMAAYFRALALRFAPVIEEPSALLLGFEPVVTSGKGEYHGLR